MIMYSYSTPSIMNYIPTIPQEECEKFAIFFRARPECLAPSSVAPNARNAPFSSMQRVSKQIYAVPLHHGYRLDRAKDIMSDVLIYARKIAAKAARPAMAIELPTVLAEPVNGVIGELLGLETTLGEILAVEPRKY